MKPLDAGGWDPAPRLPLGAAWSGHCLAAASSEPPEPTLRDLCNCGYARGRCPHFPPDSAVDAVRFAQTSGALLCILEKDHAPLAFGEFRESDHSAAIVAQARAFLSRMAKSKDA